MHVITELWDLLHCELYYLVSGIVQWCVCVEREGGERSQIVAASRHVEMVFTTAWCRILLPFVRFAQYESSI